MITVIQKVASEPFKYSYNDTYCIAHFRFGFTESTLHIKFMTSLFKSESIPLVLLISEFVRILLLYISMNCYSK